MIDEIADRIKKLEANKAKLGEKIRENSSSITSGSSFFLEGEFTKQVPPTELNGRDIIGIDGGIVKEELVGADVVLTRAVAAQFKFESGKLQGSRYIPNRSPDPEPHVFENLDRREFRTISSLLRVKKEAELVLKVMNENPELILMDGSIVPHNRDKPSKNSRSFEIYEEVLKIYEKIYKKAQSDNILLAGVVEDSRDRKLCNSLMDCLDSNEFEKVLSRTRDLDLIEKFLMKGERTTIMKYSREEGNHPVLSDLEFKGKARTFYLRTAENDLPIKIDYLSSDRSSERAEKIAGMILPISSFNRNYGIPSVIIEADQRAKLSQKHLKSLKRDLRSQVGDSAIFRDLRRNRRPF